MTAVKSLIGHAAFRSYFLGQIPQDECHVCVDSSGEMHSFSQSREILSPGGREKFFLVERCSFLLVSCTCVSPFILHQALKGHTRAWYLKSSPALRRKVKQYGRKKSYFIKHFICKSNLCFRVMHSMLRCGNWNVSDRGACAAYEGNAEGRSEISRG
jgi:hypothetical protein